MNREGPPDPLEAELCTLVAAGELDRVTERAVRAYGPELIAWLGSILNCEADTDDAFSRWAEDLWSSLRRYDGRCSMRTWCYMLARHAAARVRAEPRRRHEQLVSQMSSLPAAVSDALRTTRAEGRRRQNVYAEIRRELDEDDQTLLVLRVDRELSWRDIAIVMLGVDAEPWDITRRAASLRKQFERIKVRLRELAARYA